MFGKLIPATMSVEPDKLSFAALFGSSQVHRFWCTCPFQNHAVMVHAEAGGEKQLLDGLQHFAARPEKSI